MEDGPHERGFLPLHRIDHREHQRSDEQRIHPRTPVQAEADYPQHRQRDDRPNHQLRLRGGSAQGLFRGQLRGDTAWKFSRPAT